MSGVVKRNIFTKIFLWFLGTVILLIGAVILLDMLTTSEPRKQRVSRVVSTAMMLYGQVSADYFERGEEERYLALREKLRQSAFIDAYLLNTHGEPLFSGDPVPEELVKMALKSVSSGEKISNVESWKVAVAVPVHSKKDYIFAGYAMRIPFARFWWNEPAAVLIGRLAVVVALSAIVCYGLSIYITRPILGLQSATRRFAKGELSARAGTAVTRRKDEIGRLAEDFDNMAERIGSLLNLQRQLVGDISHELRSPLARLTLSIEMTKTMSGPEAEQLLAKMEKEVGVLNGMIGQLLNLSELESGIMSLSPVQINLKDMVEIIAGDADFEAQSAGKKVRLGDTAGCWIFGNNSLLHSAVENVVRNAVRYTQPGTEVALSIVSVARDGGRYAELTVTDQGGGVPEADLENIFRPFYRVSTARDRKSGGTGLGLHITERAVRIHNGQVRAENVEGGLRVTITLPLNGVVAGLPKEQSL